MTKEHSAPVIRVDGLTKKYEDRVAVGGITFSVNGGEVFGFLGPNGAGKTTTIRMLTGLSKPTSGNASIFGFDVRTDIVEAKRYIGVVPEISNLYEDLTAMDNLLFMGQLYGLPRNRRREKAEELLNTFGLYERRGDLFRRFSRGMKRALTISAALIHDPDILFLDEPTVGLDVVAARSLRTLVARLRDFGITVFLTTHYLEEADLLCDRVAILVKGRIVDIGTPSELKSQVQREPAIDIGFARAVPDAARRLSAALPGLRIIEADDARFRIYGGEPSYVLARALDFENDCGIRLETINTVRPTLEDAFMKIAGMGPSVLLMEKGGKNR